MAEKTINPIVKQVLELGPPLLFFVAYLQMRDETYAIGGVDYDGFIVAAAALVPLMLATTAILWKLTAKISKIQVLTVAMVVVFGGLTVWFNDEKFFKMKTSIVYGIFAGLLGIGLLRGQSYLAYVMDEMMPMEQEGWMVLTRRLAMAFAGLAIANEVVWRTMSTDAWVKIETFVFPLVLFAFLTLQILGLQKYVIEDKPKEGADER